MNPSLPTQSKHVSVPRSGASPSAAMPLLSWEIVRNAEIFVPLAVLGILMALILPIPPLLLDALISLNIAVSVIVLLVSMYIRKAVEFSIFPTALLLLTLFRLALNVSSSRLILMNGNLGTSAAGDVIESFGKFVVGGSFVIGLVMFLVLIAIQYVVINHGAVRISEVTARFTLDALPGKQMSIDADLNAGLIDEPEAKDRRKKLNQEAEFYGAMDGASRFTQRDAVAGILILLINVCAGFLIGVLQYGMDLFRAFETYTILTIGDGLVTVIPALMISMAGGLIVTRASSEGQLDAEVKRQVLTNPEPIALAGIVLVLLALVPGLPKLPFAGLGALALYGAKRLAEAKRLKDLAKPEPAAAAASNKDTIETLLRVDTVAVEVGLGLVRLVEGGGQSTLLQRISGVRKQMATDLGFVLPAVRVTDNLSLRATEYRILVKGNEMARFEVKRGYELALLAGDAKDPGHLRAIDALLSQGAFRTKEPAFQLDALWVPNELVEQARMEGCTIVDTASLVGTHFSEIVKRSACEIFTRQDTKRYVDRVAEETPKLVEDLVPKLLPLSTVQKILQNLLRERVSIRDGVSILEAMSEGGAVTRNPTLITEFVRQSIRRTITRQLLTGASELNAWFLHPDLEQDLEASVEHGEFNSHLTATPAKVRELLARCKQVFDNPLSSATILSGSNSRFFLRQVTETAFPNMNVLSHSEIASGIQVNSLGQI
ncbi:flagellar biosynthesis protein FlhA [Bryobacter aggregatus]|uniref:flagellar biosynthesis protein FlhA n=1 Tax=Bryobacter aggregatus TaxID=360054 RepID=UPI0004E0D5E5|nr:flagellar biosynthesis protein FlhA [Bryobacter aggregatus]